MSSQHYVGIDLGTVNTCLAYADDKGEVTVSRNEGGSGLLPSTILFTEEGKIVGARATEKSADYGAPDSVFYFKRLMGTDFKRYVGDVSYNPTEMSAMVIRKALMNYEKNTGMTCDTAVITVPGDFSDAERNATISAARIAGLQRIELLNESVSAAIAYRKFSNDLRDRNVIIYDLGGGTLDVTVLSISGKTFTVLSDESSKDLGGRDWDLVLATIIQRKVLDSRGMTTEDVVSDSEFRKSVMAEAEKQKVVLESNERAVSTVMLNGEAVKYTVNREEFEEATLRLMMKTVDMVGFALRNAKRRMSEIDSILLVGGSTQMPQVLRSIEEAFPSKEIIMFDPQHAVARGASLYARSIFGNQDIKVRSVSTRTIGFLGGIDGREKICNVIFRNSQLPVDKTVMCRPKRDDQDILEISIYESLAREGSDYIDLQEGRLLFKNEFKLEGKVSRGKTRIPIRFIEDKDGRLSVVAECNGNFLECGTYESSDMTPDAIQMSMFKMGDIQ